MHRFFYLGMLTLALTLVACTTESGDGKDDLIAEPGKADFLYGECEVRQVLAYVNDLEVDADRLKSDGVQTRSANNIIAHRDGTDALPGTDDDDYFDDIQELDDVYYVGPVAMMQLVEACNHRCFHMPTVEAIFSPQAYDDSHLARVQELIASATQTIDVAMYSFSDYNILHALEDAVARGVRIRFLFESANGDHNDPAGSWSARLEDLGIDVRYINKIMHHKFAIIDGPVDNVDDAYTATLATGSANWSTSAGTRYDENTVVISECGELVLRFQMEFNHLWANSRDLVWDASLEWTQSIDIHEGMIVDDAWMDAVFTSANFRTYESSTYGPTFSVIRGENEISDTLVTLIEQAETSIHVASGHLRSRPVAEALLAKWAANPQMDIRIYLDNQEYISEWYNNQQEIDLLQCLEDAEGSEARTQDCIDKGFYFSHPIYEADIPLRFKYYCYRWHYTYAEQMHHKYLIFDGKTLATGSYNLSDNAEHNTMENMVIYHADRFPNLVADFETNFESIWVTGEADGLYTDLIDEIENGTSSSFPIIFPSMALTYDEVTALKDAIYENCPDINSDDFRQNPGDHRYCDRG